MTNMFGFDKDTDLEEHLQSLFPGLDRREISAIIEICMQCMQHGIGHDEGPVTMAMIQALAEDQEPALTFSQLAEIERRTRLKNVLRRGAFMQSNDPLANLPFELIRDKNSKGRNIIESRLSENDSPGGKPEPYYGGDLDFPRRDRDW